MEKRAAELRIAFGPVGALSLLALAGGLWRRRPLLAATGAAAVLADVSLPALGGLAAARSLRPSGDVPPAG